MKPGGDEELIDFGIIRVPNIFVCSCAPGETILFAASFLRSLCGLLKRGLAWSWFLRDLMDFHEIPWHSSKFLDIPCNSTKLAGWLAGWLRLGLG